MTFLLLIRTEAPAFIVNENNQFVEYSVHESVPEVDVQVTANGRDVLLQISTRNFTFSENCAIDNPLTEGHAHIYVDGIKHSTAYSSMTVLKNLAPGKRHIQVSLNVLPDHKFVTHNGVPIQDTISVEIKPDQV